MDIELVIIVCSIFLIAVALIFLAVWLWKKSIFWKYTISALAIFLCINIYQAFYPNDSFYMREFTRVSSIKFPESGKILHKYASYPDMHGDYESCALFEVSAEEYEVLRKALESNPLSNKSMGASGCADNEKWSNVLSNYSISIRVTKEGGSESEWGILEKGKLVYFSFYSW